MEKVGFLFIRGINSDIVEIYQSELKPLIKISDLCKIHGIPNTVDVSKLYINKLNRGTIKYINNDGKLVSGKFTNLLGNQEIEEKQEKRSKIPPNMTCMINTLGYPVKK